MRMFYGYERSPDDAPDGCDQVWLDAAGTHRQERDDMILSLSPGDVVAVLARGDLGKGAEVPKIEAAIVSAGASVDVQAPPKEPPKRRGPPPKFNPDPEQDRKIRRLYHSYTLKAYVLQRANEIAGPVAWHQLKRRYGNRWDR